METRPVQARSAGPAGWQRASWLALLVAASVAFSLGFACAVPFAALGAAAALTLPRRDALVLIAGAWLANQMVGFAMLGYPWTAEAFAWGLALGAAALVATAAAQAVAGRLAGQGALAAALASFAGAFLVYEGGLFALTAAVPGGTEDYTPAAVAYILALNAAAFAVLLLASRLAAAGGFVAPPRLAAATHQG